METETIIEIKGEAVHLVKRQVERTVDLQAWIAALQTKESTSPILPKGCRLMQNRADESRVYVVECDPATRTIEWNRMEGCEVTEDELEYDGDWHNAEGQDYKRTSNRWRLAFPYTVFVVKVAAGGALEKSYFFYRNTSISTTSDELCMPNLGNLYGDLSICSGEMHLEPDLNGDKAKVDDFIGKFWASPFNADLNSFWHYYQSKDERFRSLSAWRDASAANPLFPLEVAWVPHLTVESCLRHIGERND